MVIDDIVMDGQFAVPSSTALLLFVVFVTLFLFVSGSTVVFMYITICLTGI